MTIDTTAELLKHRRTKIVATLGPASSAPRMIARLIDAGVNVFRLNMSHGEVASHRAAYEAVREAAEGRPVAVLADLAGPKIRTGRFRGGAIELEDGERVTVTTRDVLGEPGLIATTYRHLAADVRPGDRILLADGRLELAVAEVDGTEVGCTVVHGGVLEDRKGMNLPGVALSVGSLTEKDRADARFALELGVDFLGLSFVRRAADVRELRALVAEEAGDRGPAVVAKIEKPEALDDIDAIIEAADAIMVARGDLGVELPAEQVPVAQDLLVERARAAGRPVIVATQMLETMIDQARPTRAEVADISHAVTAGADAVMLSGETAVGRYPLLAVEMMDRVARQTEAYLWRHGAFETISQVGADAALPLESAFARATAILSRDLRVRAILLMPRSGSWTTIVSSVRPAAPVIALAAGERVFRRLSLAWGVLPVRVEVADLADLREVACRLVSTLVGAEPGHHLLLVRGFHIDRSEDLPSISILTV